MILRMTSAIAASSVYLSVRQWDGPQLKDMLVQIP